MPFVFKRLALFMSIAAAFAADKEAPFRAAPAASYHHQTNGGDHDRGGSIRVGREDQDGIRQARPVPVGDFARAGGDPERRERRDPAGSDEGGVRRAGEPAGGGDAGEGRTLPARARPAGVASGPLGRVAIKSKKNPLDAWEIEGRSFTAQMLPAGQAASGFFYFQTGLQTGSTVYVSGLTEAGTGKELFYFEIPLQ